MGIVELGFVFVELGYWCFLLGCGNFGFERCDFY